MNLAIGQGAPFGGRREGQKPRAARNGAAARATTTHWRCPRLLPRGWAGDKITRGATTIYCAQRALWLPT